MPEGVHLAVVDPGVGSDRKASRFAGATAGSTSAPTTASCSRGRAARRRRGGGRARRSRLPARAGRPHLPRPRRLRARRRPPGRGRRARRAGARARRRRARAHRPARAEHRQAPDPGDRRLCRPLRERPAQPHAGTDLAQVGIESGSRVEIEVGFERYYAVAARTFAEVRGGDIVLYEDAYRNIALAINRGNAAQMFGVSAGDELKISAVDS